jgi:serine/threonine-protein phosphatase 2A regulatory subunit B
VWQIRQKYVLFRFLSSCILPYHYLVFEEEEDPSNRSFFSEIISSISDVKFSRDGRYILSRDYLSLKIWDTAMESRPIRTIQIHDHLRGKLCDLYENDCIFDKFECTFSGDGRSVNIWAIWRFKCIRYEVLITWWTLMPI